MKNTLAADMLGEDASPETFLTASGVDDSGEMVVDLPSGRQVLPFYLHTGRWIKLCFTFAKKVNFIL